MKELRFKTLVAGVEYSGVSKLDMSNSRESVEEELKLVKGSQYGIAIGSIEHKTSSEAIVAFSDDIEECLKVQKEISEMEFEDLGDLYEKFPMKVNGIEVEIY